MRTRLTSSGAVTLYALSAILLFLSYVSSPTTYSAFTPPPTASGTASAAGLDDRNGTIYAVTFLVTVQLKSNRSLAVGSPIQTNVALTLSNAPGVGLSDVSVFINGATAHPSRSTAEPVNLTLTRSTTSLQGSVVAEYGKAGEWKGTVYATFTVDGKRSSSKPVPLDIPKLQILPKGTWSRDVDAWILFSAFFATALVLLVIAVAVYRKPRKSRKPHSRRLP